MSELPKRLDRLILRLDHMGLRVEQAFADALHAIRNGDVEEARDVQSSDNVIDRQEVEIEKECIRLLALYQPAAIDLRRICFIIKVNNDLERVADLACSIARQTSPLMEHSVELDDFPLLGSLAEMCTETLGRTVRMLSTTDTDTAENIIAGDAELDRAYGLFCRTVFNESKVADESRDGVYALLQIGRAIERIGDLCTNIAEDIVFLSTGEIIRHADIVESVEAE
ncbi:MAG: phosphate signaling complex protein PhoU [Planctomycetes bacterium]|jgi:phosphate transport system protein|nr:phosphate signaling complex protein PhoU [Phycisphaerae bacterium]NBB95925.1 phosphate signaling complex protein PhoU [Planctomycetota bacterium]